MFIAHTSRKAPVKARSQRSESENDMENKNCGSPLYPKVRADGAVNPPHIRRGSLLENPPIHHSQLAALAPLHPHPHHTLPALQTSPTCVQRSRKATLDETESTG